MTATVSRWTDVEPGGALHSLAAFLAFFHVFLNSAEESFRCFTLEVKDSFFLIVDSCGWSTCINSTLTLFSLYLLLSMTPVSNLSSAARFPLLSFHIACSLVAYVLVLYYPVF
ncbi:uncharacterized protein APUU_70953S [Aspergillus puulaauensis]|uniref:Uncharacterized protein n=1 Tax=Aspergillus puulaauensis TaxID=1220207 RepID=A0A7R7XYQ4_9EURO|nr:uncharacterized protein APUU_70953S [Aspergillus puulaauensis]BCS29383.1 hypothetical protein APUU_70953S [Aspergillus puulaauensis]